MPDARLELNDGLGLRVIPLDKPQLTIGRRTENDVRLTGSDVSRDHAEIVAVNGDYILKDRGSRYGTFVNETQITEQKLASGDRLQFGRAAGTDIVFRIGDNLPSSGSWPRCWKGSGPWGRAACSTRCWPSSSMPPSK
jgi:pSer/pThr/pTyr-binding forkhead associated (FHA) protein